MKKAVALILVFILAGCFTYLSIAKTKVLRVYGTATTSTIGAEGLVVVWALTPNVNTEVKEVSLLEYYASPRGELKGESKTIPTPEVVTLRIYFKLITPNNKTVEFEPLELRGAGEHKFETVIGPNEGLEEGNLTLVFEFYLKVTTPAGFTAVELKIQIVLVVDTATGAVVERSITKSSI